MDEEKKNNDEQSLADYVRAIMDGSEDLLDKTSDTDKAVAEAMDNFGNRITGVENSLGNLSASFSGFTEEWNPQETIESQVQPIRSDLTSLKKSVIQDLEGFRAILKEVDDFIGRRTAFLAATTDIKGSIDNLKDELHSVNERVKILESERGETRTRTLATWAIIVSVIGIIASAGVTIYLAFIQ